MTAAAPTRFAVLISGRGSNLAAILDFWATGGQGYPVDASAPALVVSNRPDAPGLEHAARYGVPSSVVDHREHGDREAFEAALTKVLEDHGVEWVVLAGFMRVLTPDFVNRYAGRILNTHPSLLPSFPGRDGVAAALAAGVKITGCTVHMVEAEVDAGPILAQAAVPVHPDDDRDALHARILAAEHHLYPRVISEVIAGSVSQGEATP